MSRGPKLCVAGLALVGIAWVGRSVWLPALGRYLTGAGGDLTSSADTALIPAADYIRPDVNTEMLEDAARLLREGRVRRIVMSCADFYGVSECELAERALQARGCPGARIDWLRTERLPDEVEADKAIRHLRSSGTKSAIILLPNYKVRRLGGVYQRLGARFGIDVHVWGRGSGFDPERWWKSREGQKRFAEEFVRLVGLL